MPLTGNGSDITPVRIPSTGKFDIQWDATGNPVFGDDGSHLVLSLLLEFRGLWWADPSGRRGSTLYLIKQDVSGTLSNILQAVDLALAPPLSDGRLLSVTRTCQRLGVGKYSLNINWVTPAGVSGSLPLALST